MRRPMPRRRREKGAALVIAILVLAILTVIGIALMLITSTESRIAANEWSINRAFYASDAGIRWATVQMHDPVPYMARPEFTGNPFGTVLFQLPSHRHGALGFFRGDVTETDIQVRVMRPSKVGRRPAPGYDEKEGKNKRVIYSFEVRSQGGQNDAILQYSRALVANVELGPLPEDIPF
ncbi:MAG: pilus assembly PilX family protein [Thermoanaerobaculia bacterium]